MISVCVPVYNYDVRPLVKSLVHQAKTVDRPVEIIIAEDGSNDRCRKINEEVKVYNRVRLIQQKVNIGRSAIRNLLAKNANFQYILYLDCDSELKGDFIANYLQAIKDGTDVICGGTLHPETKPEKQRMLRWKAGRNREDRTAESRMENKYASFTSNNFVVSKSVLKDVTFNPKIKQYGHEDTLFGIELEQKGYNIQHINNPAIHIGLDKNREYIDKTKQAIENLAQLLKHSEYKTVLPEKITLAKYFSKIQKYRLRAIIKICFMMFKPLLIANLKSSKPNLLVFDFFKIGYLTSIY